MINLLLLLKILLFQRVYLLLLGHNRPALDTHDTRLFRASEHIDPCQRTSNESGQNEERLERWQDLTEEINCSIHDGGLSWLFAWIYTASATFCIESEFCLYTSISVNQACAYILIFCASCHNTSTRNPNMP